MLQFMVSQSRTRLNDCTELNPASRALSAVESERCGLQSSSSAVLNTT